MVEQLPIDVFEISEKGHGRHSFWSVSIFSATSSSKSDEWKGLKRFIHVHKEVFYTNTIPIVIGRKKRQTVNDRLYISSKNHNSAKYFHQGIRKHWSSR